MKTQGLPYVSARAFAVAQEFERRICTLPPETGIIFAGVHAVPAPGGESGAFNITVGVDRVFEERTIDALLRNIFGKELLDGQFTLSFKVVRGLVGSAGHKALSKPHSVQA